MNNNNKLIYYFTDRYNHLLNYYTHILSTHLNNYKEMNDIKSALIIIQSINISNVIFINFHFLFANTINIIIIITKIIYFKKNIRHNPLLFFFFFFFYTGFLKWIQNLLL